MNESTNIPLVPPPPANTTTTNAEPKLYSISTKKLATLWVCSFGLYSLVWAYNNWQAIKNKGENISPGWRAIFSIFFYGSLFARILKYSKEKGYTETFSPAMLYCAMLVLFIVARISQYTSLVALFAFLPIIPVQKAIRFYNKSIDPNFQEPNKFWPGEIAVVVIGGILLALSIIGFIGLLSK
jgi:hypothetical protein